MFVTAWNIIWVIGSNIYEIEADNRRNKSSYSENDLNRFDQFMYRGEISLTFLVYNLILLAGPLDISKIYMLQKNIKIYAILLCLLGGVKLIIQGIIFDSFISRIILSDFIYNRGVVIFSGLASIVVLIPIIKIEYGNKSSHSEHTSNTTAPQKNRGLFGR